ncbi:ABC transporter family substrate-binding protein [Tersicoccus solisilvae]|uniref:ABC transporter family substrate-binding protein n=1 Tax=Tersicoccus solisilvae TaxID=1882339 RepID=UPI0027B8A9BD|nr:ABC transporter family substrate-binding protein [Tersicoccus solisilvae]
MGAAAIAALALSACGGNTGGGNNAASGSSTSSGGGQITVAEVNGFSSFNQSTANGNSDINGKIWYSTHAGFNYISKDLEVVKNEKFGKYEKVSDDPLTVKYTINDGVKWSDGTPVTADDYVLAWAVYSGWYDDATLDPNTGEVTKGNQYFEYAGTTLGLNNSKFPTVSEDKKSFTIEYTVPYADWEIAFNAPEVPAHVVAKKSGLADANALTSLFKGMKKGDKASPAPKNAQLQKVADFYNKGFDSTSLPSDPSLYLSNGPFVVSSITDGESVTLKKNPDYTWGTPAKVDTIVMRTIGDTQAQVQALKNGEVDIAAPQASADTLTSLEEIQGAQIQKGDQLAYDHLDLNYSGVFADKNVRDAFMKTVPRKQIVEGILTKMKPDAKILDSQLFVPAQDGYEKAAQENGSQNYQDVDIEGAKKLLAGKTPTVRIMYNKDNPNRVDAYTLIAQSATQAGFKIVNNGAAAKEWSGKLGDGTYDATVFGWTNPGVGVVGTSQIFGTGQSSNFNKFSSPEADKLMSELNKTTDDAKKTELQQQIDKLVWDSKYGLPLFQSYGVEAFSDRVTGGVNYNPQQYGVWWDVWDWQLK